MIWLFKRYFWIINILWITAAAYLCSDIFLHVIDGRLDILISPQAASKLKKKPDKTVQPESKYMNIQELNLFNPSARGEKKESTLNDSTDLKPISKEIEVSTEKMALRGTIIPILSDNPALDEKKESYQQEARAIIEDFATRKQTIYSINQQVGTKKIVAIRRTEVILSRPDGSLERLVIDFNNKSGKGFTSARGRSTSPFKPSTSKVEKISASSYAINREDVIQNVQNMSQFLTQLRVRPHFQNGQPAGFLVSNIKRGSLVEQLGLNNGDVIKSVNGQQLNRPDQLFQAYQQLQNEDMIEMEIERKGQLENFSYIIR